MAKRKKRWVYVGNYRIKPKVTEHIKSLLKEKADRIIENELKKKYIKKVPDNYQLNYIVDIYSEWFRNFFYFCKKYNSPGPNSISPSFEKRFARMEYTENGTYILSYMRHTGQWWPIFRDLDEDKCLELITTDSHFL